MDAAGDVQNVPDDLLPEALREDNPWPFLSASTIGVLNEAVEEALRARRRRDGSSARRVPARARRRTFEPVREHQIAVLGQDRLGMELNALEIAGRDDGFP